jgi:hypothetical protein
LLIYHVALFASQIMDSVLLRQPLGVMFAYREGGFGGSQERRLATIYGGAILTARLSATTNDLSCCIKDVLNNLFELRAPSSDVLRRQHIRDFCHAITAHGDWANTFALFDADDSEEGRVKREVTCFQLPNDARSRRCLAAAAAAVGDLDLLRSSTNSVEDVIGDGSHYHGKLIIPDPFRAAAATGKLDVVEWGLSLVRTAFEAADEMPKTQRIAYRRTAYQRSLSWALHSAIRRSQASAALLIADFIFSWDAEHWHKSHSSKGIEEAIRRGENDLLVELLSRRLASDPKLGGRNLTAIKHNWLVLTDSEKRCLFSVGSRRTLAHLLDCGALHPDGLTNDWTLLDCKLSRPCFPVTLPISLALHSKRHDLVRMLLDKGANINARAGGTQWGFESPLQDVVDRADTAEIIQDVQYLIEQGASAEQWRELWQTERNGRLKPLWDALMPSLPEPQFGDFDYEIPNEPFEFCGTLNLMYDMSPEEDSEGKAEGELEGKAAKRDTEDPVDMNAGPDPVRRAKRTENRASALTWACSR